MILEESCLQMTWNRKYVWKTFSYERKEEGAQMSIEVCVKYLHKLETLSHIQVIVLGAPQFCCGSEIFTCK